MSSAPLTTRSSLLAVVGARLWRGLAIAIAGIALVSLVSCDESASVNPGGTPQGAAQPLPHYDHVVVVIEENHSYSDIIGSSDAPYINSLAQQGALFTDAHAVTHPSQPNYLALFAGSTFGLTSDDCPQSFSSANLGGELIAQGLTFTGYSEDLPAAGDTSCTANDYARKHNPWVNFSDVPADSNQPFSNFPSDYSQLPTVAFVVPNLGNDMHDGSISTGDSWLHDHLDGYIQWTKSHNSLCILTWDEDDGSTDNHILTIFVGAHVHQGQYAETINHYHVLRTIEALTGVSYTSQAANVATIADIWQSGG
jgi:phosphatidylinositol-3-phosphatase